MKQTKACSIFILSLFLITLSCNSNPVPIEYGADECHRCKMIISDERFGAELITTKGKVYKFDAIECLVPMFLEKGAEEFSTILVTDYFNPRQFVTATEATYLISEQLPSPMGGFLSAYSSEAEAEKALKEYQGTTYHWEEILDEYD